LADDSSNIELWVATETGADAEVTRVAAGEEFVTESAAVYFYVRVLDGYSASTNDFVQRYVNGDPSRTGYYTADYWSGTYQSTTIKSGDSNQNPGGINSALALGCSYRFQYTGKTEGSKGDFWGEYKITPTPIKVHVTYEANGGIGAPTDLNTYYHSNVTEAERAAAGALYAITVPETTPTKTGENFLGWRISGAGKIYKPGDVIDIADIWSSAISTGGTITFVAVWGSGYAISYNGNGHTNNGSLEDSNLYGYGETATILSNNGSFKKYGYEFVCWNTEADGSGTRYNEGQNIIVTGNLELYAQWRLKNNITINYESSNESYGSVTYKYESLNPDEDAKTGSKATANEGYEFKGWKLKYSAGDTYISTATDYIPKLSDISATSWSDGTTFVAVFEARTQVTITYDGNDGKTTDNKEATTQTGYAGDFVIISDNVFSRDGYTFTGWNTAKDGNGTVYAAGTTYTLSEDMTLYAQWTKWPQLTYQVNPTSGGSVSLASEYVDPTAETVSGSTVTVNEGYYFKNWTDNNNEYSNTTITPEKPTTGWVSNTYTANLGKKAKITYNLTNKDDENDNLASSSESIKETETAQGVTIPNGYTVEEVKIKVNGEETDIGYTKDKDGKIIPDTPKDRWTDGAEYTVEITLEKIAYTVTYHRNYGENDDVAVVDTKTYSYGDTVVVTGSPWTVKNYTFKYWTLEVEDGDAVDNTLTVTDNINLYAQWAPKGQVTIYYKVNATTGGTVKLNDENSVSSDKVIETILPEDELKGATAEPKDGYYFVGWEYGNDYENYTISGLTGAKCEPKITGVDWPDGLTFTAVFAEKTSISVSGAEKNITYDGSSHSVSGYTISGSGITINDNAGTFGYDGKTYTVTGIGVAVASGTDVGEYPEVISVEGIKITTGSGTSEKDVTEQFSVTTSDGNLKINPRDITLVAGSDSVEYDGEKHTVGYTISGSGINYNGIASGEFSINNDKFTVSGVETGEYGPYVNTYVTSVATTSSFSIQMGDSVVTDNFNVTTETGTLAIKDRTKPYEVTVKTNSATATYDGKEHSVSGFVGETDGRVAVTVSGSSVTYYVDVNAVTTSAVRTNAGVITGSEIDTSKLKVYDGNNDDVTNQFTINVEYGTLTITKRSVTLTSATDSKYYDGSALSNENVDVTSGSFAEGEGAEYSGFSSATEIGKTIKNDFTYVLTGGAIEANYDISQEYGTLTILSRDPNGANKDRDDYPGTLKVTLTANSDMVTYDGEDHTVTGFVGFDPNATELTINQSDGTAAVSGAAANVTFTVTGLSASGTGKDVNLDENGNNIGYTVEVVSDGGVKVYDGDVDVTNQFTVTTVNGTLKINPVDITIKPEDKERVYDGTPLEASEVEVKNGRFIGNDGSGVKYSFTGSQTIVGVTSSTVSIKDWGNAGPNNYNVTTEPGTLTVTSRRDDEGNAKTGDEAPYTIVIKGNSADYTYDGKEKTCEGFIITDSNGNELKGDVVAAAEDGYPFTASLNGKDAVNFRIENVEAKGKGTNAGVYPVAVTDGGLDYKIVDVNGNDVTSQFTIETKDGTLTIKSAGNNTDYIPSTTPSDTTIVDTVNTDTVDKVGNSNTEDDTVSDGDDEELDDVTIKKVNSSNSSSSDDDTSTTGTNKNSRKRSGNLPSTGEPIDLLIWAILGVTCSAAAVLLIYFAICGFKRKKEDE
jgi:uncharacterized repeat protein (TIGR02543 family)